MWLYKPEPVLATKNSQSFWNIGLLGCKFCFCCHPKWPTDRILCRNPIRLVSNLPTESSVGQFDTSLIGWQNMISCQILSFCHVVLCMYEHVNDMLFRVNYEIKVFVIIHLMLQPQKYWIHSYARTKSLLACWLVAWQQKNTKSEYDFSHRWVPTVLLPVQVWPCNVTA